MYVDSILKMSLARCGSVSARTRMYFRRLMVMYVDVDAVGDVTWENAWDPYTSRGSFWARPCVVKRIQGVTVRLSNASISAKFDIIRHR
ncbi:hypothetical protein E2C01_069031 [Portunus trituberculatus]|uniref:Uncharacterized protein n=1 Tax=Portunus trituberculatus TaxID=210409 RepID=A0A5B7HP20_PORTR|nr:hypothetical protein [Portunus trituberculatus]